MTAMWAAAQDMPLSGWGRYPALKCRVARANEPSDFSHVPWPSERPMVARGLGRSYGDASLCADLTLDMRALDRLQAYDPITGTVDCEAGTSLDELLDFLVPRGRFPAVTPGTRYVTVGGMIASDVHGKNHHQAGSFAAHVEHLDLALGDGAVLRCSPKAHAELFWATCGGMGLTGVVLAARLRTIPIETARVVQTTRRASHLGEALALLDNADDSTYSVAWIDCLASGAALGRSVVFLGEHAPAPSGAQAGKGSLLQRRRRAARTLPVDLPNGALNGLSVRLFNTLYYHAQRPGQRVVDLEPYFYPLDALRHWNRMYGSRGFVQYQCALPPQTSADALRELLQCIAQAGIGSFLAVLKKLGPANLGMLSFPMPGHTLALDFPATTAAFDLLNRLDRIVQEAHGRLYLAKDARVSREVFESGYPRVDAFRQLRRDLGLDRRFKSAMSERLGL